MSATDARLALTQPAYFAALPLPLAALLTLRQHPLDAAPITCTPGDTLASVLAQLAAKHPWGHCHRAWVLDATGRVVNVIALRDIITRFVREPAPDYFGSYFWA